MKITQLFICVVSLLLAGLGAARAQDTNSYYLQRAMEEIDNGNLEGAYEWLDKEIKENPENGKAYFCLAVLDYAQDQYGKALTNIDKAISKVPKRDKETGAMAFSCKGDILLALRDTTGALDCYNQAIRLDPESPDFYYDRGNLYYDLEKYDLSDSDFKRMCQLDPGSTTGYMGLARNAIATEQYAAAIPPLDRALLLNPEESQALAFRAEAYLGMKNWNDAVDDIIKSLGTDGNPKAYFLMLTIADEALPAMKAKLQIQANMAPNEALWPFYLGCLQQRKNNYREAIKQYTKANERDANSVYLEDISECYFELGDYRQALTNVDKALAMQPDDSDLYLLKANILNEMGNQPAAIEEVGKYIEMCPDFYYGYYRRGWFKDEMDDTAGAIDDYTMAITLEPSYAYAYNGRGQAYDLLGNRDAAVADFRKVIELDTIPGEGSCAQYAYFYLGQPDKAIDFMQRYLDNPDEGDADGGNYDAACLYSLMGERDKALYHLRESFRRGYRRFAHIAVDHDLDNIRDWILFRNLVEKYQNIQAREEGSTSGGSEKRDATTAQSKTVEVPFVREQGVTKVKCTINDLPLHFVFDTGASDVTMSMVEATFMLKNGYIRPSDIIGTARYADANGDISEGTVVNLRHVDFGGLKLDNVRASVVKNQKAPLLLGQSVLGRLGNIEIDNTRAVLRITHIE